MLKMFKSLLELTEKLKTEKACIKFFIERRFQGNITCPYKLCFRPKNNKIYEFSDGKRFYCKSCKRTFSYKTGTIFENSKIPMKKWLMAIYLHTAHKKGISSLQLSKDIHVTQKAAWFILQRIRYIEGNNFFKGEFDQTIEVDEAYFGGKAENKNNPIKKEKVKKKQIVIGMIERETGKVKTFKVNSSTYPDLAEKVINNVKIGANLITDELISYKTLEKYYKHSTVNHSIGEYVKKINNPARQAFKIHTNTIEGYWSLLKRGINGIYYWTSKKHIQRYLDEFAFRYNTREKIDGARFNFFLENTKGRLKYYELIANDEK